MRVKIISALAMTLLMVTLAANVSVAGDKQSGTWKINLEKSTYSPGPAPKDNVLKIDADDAGIKLASDGTDGDGNAMHIAYDAKFDGKDYPISGIPYGDTVSVKRIDANTMVIAIKKSGAVTMTVKSVVSKDGKTRTSTFTGKDASGKDVKNVVVYDKQ